VLTGDTLFVGAVGRPDLRGAAEASARALHRNLRRLLAHATRPYRDLPDPLRGLGLLAFEKRFNPLLGIAAADQFVAALTRELPPMPANIAATVRANQGRP